MVFSLVSLSIFLFVFSILLVLKNTFNFFSALFSNPPKKFQLTNLERLYLGLCVSYVITFVISLFI